MVKTQVQIPDHLYREAKRIAAERELSFAEVVRRGLERMAEAYPPNRTAPDAWQLPAVRDMGETLLSEEEWDAASHE